MSALVFDLGGTHLRAGVVASDGTLTHLTKARIGRLADGLTAAQVWRDVLSRLNAYIEQHGADGNAREPIVISFPGPIDEAGRIVGAPTVMGGSLEIPDMRTELAATSGRPVRIINDLSAATWYLSRSVAGRFLVATVSSGIGSKIYDPILGVLDDTPYAGEIGHGIADESPDAVICDCGGRGHLGAIASGRGIEQMARRHALAEPHAFAQSECVRRFGATAATLRNEPHLVPALRNGDPWITNIVGQSCRYFARVLNASIIVAGLRSVIIIGGFALAAGEAYLKILRAAMQDLCDYELLRASIGSRLTLGAVDDEACLLGAAACARAAVCASSEAGARAAACARSGHA